MAAALDPDRQKALAAAARAGDLPAVRALLQAGARPNDNQAYSPLVVAGMTGQDAVFFEMVRAGADLHAVGPHGVPAFAQMADRASLAVMQAVISDGLRKSDDLPLALHGACASNTLEVVRALVSAGADVNQKGRTEGTPLLTAASRNRPEIVAELLRCGADAGAALPRSDFGNKKHFKKTALEIATLEGYVEIVALLKAAGAKPPAPPPRPAASGTVAESWTLVRKWLKANAPGWTVLNKRATPAQLAATEEALGARLPEDLRESYALHNGGGAIFPHPNAVAFTYLPLDELLQNWTVQRQLLEGGDFDDSTAPATTGVRSEWWNTGWIPFASDGGGDLLCIDTAPAAGGAVGQVITHDHETGAHTVLAPSLRVWLHGLAHDLRDGLHSYDADEDCLA